MKQPAPCAPRPLPHALRTGYVAFGIWSLVLPVWAEQTGAVGSRSAHEPDSAEEALEHEHRPRHGGAFGDAEDLYHYELLVEPPDRLILYVNDEHNQPLDTQALQARWKLNPDDEEPIPGDFVPAEDGSRFLAVLPPQDMLQPIHLEIEVLKDSQWVGMEFFLMPGTAQEGDSPAPAS